jgi:2-amino-4-hydroxy-6-hydroxymethyldihydropteridine diphosphokinase
MSVPVIVGLGSNLGDRVLHLRRAIEQIAPIVRVVRLSGIWETEPLDSPAGSSPFLNAVLAGVTAHAASEVLERLQSIEFSAGRRRGIRNAPRPLDLDLLLYGSALIRSHKLTVPHPRYRERNFVLAPLSELGLRWREPSSGRSLVPRDSARGTVRRIGAFYSVPR